jgi:RNA polymerase sigma factor (sigma-70 family)
VPDPSDPTDPLDDFARDLIRKKAARLVGRAGLTRSDREDLEQELALRLLQRWPAFRPDKGRRATFVRLVVDHAAADLVRRRRAKKRGPARLASLDALARTRDDGLAELARALGGTPGPEGREDLRIDVAGALARLPPDLRAAAEALMAWSFAEAARQLGLAPSTLRDRARRVREVFEQAGLQDYCRRPPSDRGGTG